MRILVFGGAGFVGLNIAAALLACGHAVTLFDRAGLPPDARKEFALHGDRLTAIQGDVTDSQAVGKAIATGYDAIILGAAITAGPAREASDPETILRVNLLAQAPILIAARKSGVKRIINLSSAAAYGASAFRNVLLDEETPCDPASLYAITKFASEKIAARLAGLWQQEIISVRLSAVFGPWERSNDVRDTPSPQAQILAAMQEGYRGRSVAPGRQGLDLCRGCRGGRDIADRGCEAAASALQHFIRRGMVRVAMGRGASGLAPRLHLPPDRCR